MQFNNLKAQYQELQSDIHARIHTVLEHGQYILGPEVKELETQLAHYVGVKHCITVANGTDALMIAMLALGIKPGDEVITSPFSFIANAEMIALLGAKPTFVDIDPQTYNIDARKISAKITSRTKCIMPISLYGQCSDMHAINQLAAENNLPVIEDGAQSFGATYAGKRSGSLATIGCTSFFPSKPLGCYGDGGACFTNDDALATAMRELRVHGQDRRYHHARLGMNSRLDTLQAAILLSKFSVFEKEVTNRMHIGQRYTNLLKDFVKTPTILSDNTCVYAQYTIEVDHREKVQAYLREQSIPTAVHYPIPLHKQPIFDCSGENFPHAERAAQRVMSLPMHPYLTEENQKYIVAQLHEAISFSKEVVS